MRLSILLFLLLLSCPAVVNAQYNSFLTETPDSSIHVYLNGMFALGSDHLPLRFTSDIFSGGFLTNEDKQNALDHLKEINHFNFNNEFGVTVLLIPSELSDSGYSSRLFAGYSHQTMMFATFTDDALRLLMLGNEFTLGNTAVLDNTRFSYHQFSKFYIGAIRSFGKNNEHRLAVSPFISFHKPPLQLNVHKGRVFTETDTSEVSVLLDGEFKTGFQSEHLVQSIGGGIDMHYMNASLLTSHSLIFSIENLGVFQYQGNSYSFAHDSAFEYSGFHLTDFNHLDSTLSGFADSLITNAGLKEDSTSLTSLLPVKLSLRMLQTNFEKYGLSGSIVMYPFHQQFPEFEIIPLYRISKNWIAGLPLSFGSMNGIRAGLFTGYQRNRFSMFIFASSAHQTAKGLSQTGFTVSGQMSYRF